MSDRHLLRPRSGHTHARVTSIELFFDLVFVFAITQLSHHLLGDFTPAGGLHTTMLLMAVWWMWIFTSWITNWLDPEKIPVRLSLLVIMLVGLVMSAAIPAAFTTSGLVFAGGYVLIQVGRTLFMVWACQGQDRLRENFERILVWLSVSGVFWVTGGLADPALRWMWWSAALFLDYISPIMSFRVPGLGASVTTEWDVEGAHLAERCGLFIIIALGESILVTGATFAELAWTGETIAALAVAFVGSIAMWWIYFDTSAEAATETIATSDDPGRLARSAYTYLHLPLVAGIIVAAVGDELVLAHPGGPTDTKVLIAVAGGAAIYLVGTALFRFAIVGSLSLSHALGLLALALLVPLSSITTPLQLTMASTVVLVSIALWDGYTKRSTTHS
jgi:low temperature requirement protein LtrA